mmetsp:Transcript_53613/g.160492  ORF Transcript_53613/g.160492 Transcript_53613/m.160492 type:complete len:82 (-) Transcript_53613:1377-1622(-)
MSTSSDEAEAPFDGSWTPTIAIASLLLLRWIVFGKGDTPVRIRRWYNMQRVQWRKKLGYRDDSKYKMKAGDGSNERYKRQG